MKTRHGGALALAVGGLWLVACGGGIGPEDFAQEYGEALCQWQARCGEIHDVDACVLRQRDFLLAQRAAGLSPFQHFSGSLDAGRLRFDEDAAEACVERLREHSCEEPLLQRNGAIACATLVGQREDGERCAITEDCGPSSYCEGATLPACGAGTCRPRTGPGERLPPASVESWCAPGLVPVGEVCQPASKEGEPCEDGFQCAPALYCDGQARVCRRHVLVGEACGEGVARCLPHLRCAEGRCQTLAGVGAPCTPAPVPYQLWERSGCQRDLFCDGAVGADTGTCRERLGEGRPCRTFGECQQNLTCGWHNGEAVGTCRQPGTEGAPCDEAACGPGLYCDVHTVQVCRHQGRLGEACDSHVTVSCIPGLLCEAGTCQPAFGGFCGEL